jgi:hypothetical protein
MRATHGWGCIFGLASGTSTFTTVRGFFGVFMRRVLPIQSQPFSTKGKVEDVRKYIAFI